MRYSASATVLIALTVLCSASCSVSRKASSSERLLRTETVTRDTVWQQVVVAVHDTLREVTTITLQQDAQGDTVKLVQITDRTRASRSEGYRDREEKIVVKTDTVYVAIDSVTVNNRPATVSSKRSTVNQTLKWLFAILCAAIVLTLTIRFCLRKAL